MRTKSTLLALACLLAAALAVVVLRAGDQRGGTTVSEIDLPAGPGAPSPAATSSPPRGRAPGGTAEEPPGPDPRGGRGEPPVVGGEGIPIDEDDQDDQDDENDQDEDEGEDDDDGDTDEGDD